MAIWRVEVDYTKKGKVIDRKWIENIEAITEYQALKIAREHLKTYPKTNYDFAIPMRAERKLKKVMR